MKISSLSYLTIATGLLCWALTSGSKAVETPKSPSPKPWVSWDFEELKDGTFPSQGEAYPAKIRDGQVKPCPGVIGKAAWFSGKHKLRIEKDFSYKSFGQFTLSAWVQPTRFDRYNEIFRIEGHGYRVLFSFQEHGRILSLGLHTGGVYVECDAPISPDHLLNHDWHHVAATYDGQRMRVFHDGIEIAFLEQPGKIKNRHPVSGCIGSFDGRESFQGGIDELQIYPVAIGNDDIIRQCEAGGEAIAKRRAEIKKAFQQVYTPQETFGKTLDAARQQLLEKKPSSAGELAVRLVRELHKDFPQEAKDFFNFTHLSSSDLLKPKFQQTLASKADYLYELLIEYKPLTPDQIKKQTPEDKAKCQEAARIGKQLDELKKNQSDPSLYKWADWICAVIPKVAFRPYVQEPVAPYRTPSTPETRDLTPAEAQDTLHRDWLHQADRHPTRKRIEKEIARTEELIDRLEKQHHDAVNFSAERAKLEKLQKQVEQLAKDQESKELYFAVRALKRQVMFANPVVDFDKLLFVDMPFPDGKEWNHETRHRLGYMAVPGARLMTLEGLSPEGHLTQLMPQAPLHGSFWRPDLSFDAKRVLFCFKPHNEKSFHLYEINLDGTGLRQITDGPFDDVDPIYLPDGENIAFATTRAHNYVRCMPPTNSFVLARCRLDGKKMYFISHNNEPDYLPSLLPDGRLVYTRWEYTDKPLWRAQSLWTVNPDGTQANTLWGNQSVWPDLLKDARPIPNSRRVMFTGCGHHRWFHGSIGIVDPTKGNNFPNGLTKITAEIAWPECGNGPIDPIESPKYHTPGKYHSYDTPYPLSETDFLVSAQRAGTKNFVLYLMDVDGNRELIYEGKYNIFNAMPVRPRPRPTVIPDRVDWPTEAERLNPKPGMLYSGNVYYGAPAALRGKVKYLRMLSIEPKTYTYWHKRPYISTGPVVSMVQSDGVKRVIGTIPVEPDGSFSFHAPSGLPLHFQLLDENHLALQTMRSFVGVQPGERRGCLGCHESHSKSPNFKGQAIALKKAPSEITPPPWKDTTVSYDRYVQPVLDRYCAECHQGDGEGRKTFDMTRRPGFSVFDEPYVTMIGRPTWGKPYEKPKDPPPGFGIAGMIITEGYSTIDPKAYLTPEPMTALSYRSKLIEIASSGKHNDVKVDPESLRRLIHWVDAMCPYRGDEEIRAIEDPDFQGIDWLSIRPYIKNAPTVVRPGPIENWKPPKN